MTDHESRLRAALEAGPTPGQWRWTTDRTALITSVDDRNEYILWPGNALTCAVQELDPAQRESEGRFEGYPRWAVRLGACGMRAEAEAEANAKLIAAANPEAIRSLLDELDALRGKARAFDQFIGQSGGAVSFLADEVERLRATTSRGDSAKRLSDAPAGLGVERLSGGWQLAPKGPTAEMLAAAPLPDATVTQGHSHGSEQDGQASAAARAQEQPE